MNDHQINNTRKLSKTYSFSIAGYSVATGTTGGNLALLVTGIPRKLGSNLLGYVEVYDEEFYILANFTGEQVLIHIPYKQITLNLVN